MTEPTPQIVIDSLSVRYRHSGIQAVRDLSLSVVKAERVALLGVSGSGKTTCLNVLAGIIDDRDAALSGNATISVEPSHDPPTMGYVYERDGLLPWRNLERNISLGLNIRGMDPANSEREVERLVSQMGLSGYEKRLPHELSAGMRQRAALARTFAVKPSVLLMDEPFRSLDVLTRAKLYRDIDSRWEEQGFTMLLVTHDVDEALILSHRVVIVTKPATVARIVDVPFGWPRDPVGIRTEPSFQHLSGLLWQELANRT